MCFSKVYEKRKQILEMANNQGRTIVCLEWYSAEDRPPILIKKAIT